MGAYRGLAGMGRMEVVLGMSPQNGCVCTKAPYWAILGFFQYGPNPAPRSGKTKEVLSKAICERCQDTHKTYGVFIWSTFEGARDVSGGPKMGSHFGCALQDLQYGKSDQVVGV